jgi:hypothetical protein
VVLCRVVSHIRYYETSGEADHLAVTLDTRDVWAHLGRATAEAAGLELGGR